MRDQALDQGRELLRKQSWSAAFSRLSSLDREAPLAPEDLEGLASAAQLIGREGDSADLLSRAHRGFLDRGDTRRAARCALWLGFNLMLSGEQAQSAGWIARASRLLDNEPDCVEKGYLHLPVGYRSIHGGDVPTAYRAFIEAATIGERFPDRDAITLPLQGRGRALIRQGEIPGGFTPLHEASVAARAGALAAASGADPY